MAHQPRTKRSTADEHNGKPCIHFTDEDLAVLQVHQRPDGTPGFDVSAGLLLFGVLFQVDFKLTQGQAHELLSYLRETV